MAGPQEMTDRSALMRNRARAQAGFADFLHQAAMDEITERLIEVNRAFTAPLIVSGFPDVWADLLPNARVIEDSDVLDVQPQSHDLAIHGLCLHWANDPVGQLIQMQRALRPDGLMLACLFGGDTLTELRDCMTRAEVGATGGLSPRIAPMAEIRDLGSLLQRAGFALPVADAMRLNVTYDNPPALMRDLRAMGETNALTSRLRHPTRAAVLKGTEELYQKDYGLSDGRIPATFEVIFLTGWAPHASQQKPLKPGSAKVRLADALRIPEDPKD